MTAVATGAPPCTAPLRAKILPVKPRYLLVFVLLVVGLAVPALARRKPTAAKSPRPVPAPSAHKDPPPPAVQVPGTGPAGNPPVDPETLVAMADDITRQVVALRGLELKRPFSKGVLDREGISTRLRERLAKEYNPDEIQIESRMLKRLGLLPADADYLKLLDDLLMEQVAGFYDPYSTQLYVADWLDGNLQQPAMAHEIEHALQDQHFNLKSFAMPLKEDGDRQLAHSALVEGDGTAVMLEFVARTLNIDVARLPDAIEAIAAQLTSNQMQAHPGPGNDRLTQAPRFLRETLTFPYFSGMKFVLATRKGHPWSRINEVFRDPPESTEQILHPEKYQTHEHPMTVASTALHSLGTAKELRRDVLGEFGWSLLLFVHLDDALAQRAAAGWGGDRVVAYGGPEGPVAVATLSTWDTEQDALEMESALRRWLAKHLGQPEPAADQPAVLTKDGESWSVERHGREILALFGVAEESRGAMVEEIWKGWKVGAPPAKKTPAPTK